MSGLVPSDSNPVSVQSNDPGAGAGRAGVVWGNRAAEASRRSIRCDASTLHFLTLFNFDHLAEINSRPRRPRIPMQTGMRRVMTPPCIALHRVLNGIQ
jgi:hypothetical protein